MNEELEVKIKNLPDAPGVYQFKDSNGKIIYVGKAKSLKNRVKSYFQRSSIHASPKLSVMVPKIKDVDVIVTTSEVEALILEANLIKKYKPKYNVSLKDDKGYPYIAVTNEPFPRVITTRKIKNDGSRYFGPYTDVKSLKQTLKLIRDIFMVRSCNYHIDDDVIKKGKIKLCLDYYIKKCGGPCQGLVSKEEYNEMIKQVIELLSGKTESIAKMLREKMEKLSEELRFEEAAIIRDKIKALEIYTSKQSVVSIEPVDRDILAVAYEENDGCGVLFKVREGKLVGSRELYINVAKCNEKEIVESVLTQYYLNADYIPDEILIPVEIDDVKFIEKWLCDKKGGNVKIRVPETDDEKKIMKMCLINAKYRLGEYKIQKLKLKERGLGTLKLLKDELRLEKLPLRIECFDISNIQGSDIVASVVVFENGKPKKSEYRKFKIRSVSGEPNDFESMFEVVERRYSRLLSEGGKMPDLIVIDGGKGQLSSALKALEKLGIENQQIIAIAKRREEIYIPGADEPISLSKTSPALYLLQRIRNEAHRFAITYHRDVRAKRTLKTELLEIEGVGEKRAMELLTVFGSVEGIKKASVEEISKVVGKKLAEKIKAKLNP